MILGSFSVRVGGELVDLTPALAKTVILLAARGAPVWMRELKKELEVTEDSVHHNISKIRKLDIPVTQTGRGQTGQYCLDPARCLVDADEFVRGVEGPDIDALLSLWRGPVAEFPGFLTKGLDSPYWTRVKGARSRLSSASVDCRRRTVWDWPGFPSS